MTMGRTAKPRKAHRPRQPNPLSLVVAMQGSARLTLDDRLRWQADLADTLRAVRTGTAQVDQWRLLFDAVNLVEELCKMHLARDEHGVVAMAQVSLMMMLERQQASGIKAARASELRALDDVVAAYADLMAGISYSQRFDAEQRVATRMRRVLKGLHEPGTVVVEAPAESQAGQA